MTAVTGQTARSTQETRKALKAQIDRGNAQRNARAGQASKAVTKKAPSKTARLAKPAVARAAETRKTAEQAPGTLPILYMLSPHKFMSPFDCNMAADAGYKIVLPYDNVTVGDVAALVQDAIFSRPPKARTGIFIGGKDIDMAFAMMAAARRAMVPNFEVSVFADPGGSFTTAAAMVACTERVLARQFKRGWQTTTVSVFGAMGVVGFTSSVIAASQGARVRLVAHDTLEPLVQLAGMAKERFDVALEPVLGNSDQLKAKLVRESDVIFTAGPAGINIISRQQIARASKLLVAADVNAVAPMGVEGMGLYMDGMPLPGCSALGIGALAIGDIKYKTQAGLFKRMLASAKPLDIDFRDAFVLARDLVMPARKGRAKA